MHAHRPLWQLEFLTTKKGHLRSGVLTEHLKAKVITMATAMCQDLNGLSFNCIIIQWGGKLGHHPPQVQAKKS